MGNTHTVVRPGRKAGTVFSESGEEVVPPEGWAFLPAGDAAITRSVKTKGSSWVVRVRKGRREISKGIWANKLHILEAQKEVEGKRSTPEYSRTREKDLARRDAKQKSYVGEFFNEVLCFLDFHSRYEKDARLLAEKVTAHATPVGSGTVARTKRIPVERRAEAAVIAWMRHETMSYDSMRIERIEGRRREVRRELAGKSVEILRHYRQGREVGDNCPLKKALNGGSRSRVVPERKVTTT